MLLRIIEGANAWTIVVCGDTRTITTPFEICLTIHTFCIHHKVDTHCSGVSFGNAPLR